LHDLLAGDAADQFSAGPTVATAESCTGGGVAHRITATARFHPLTDMRPFGGTGTVLRGRAYFGAESSVWSYDIRRNEVTGPYDVGRRVLGIGAAPNARAVRVVRFDGEVVRLRRND